MTLLASDAKNRAIQCVSLPDEDGDGAVHTVAVEATSNAMSAVISGGITAAHIISTVSCHVTQRDAGAPTATTVHHRLPADVGLIVKVTPGKTKLAFIRAADASGDGIAYITEME